MTKQDWQVHIMDMTDLSHAIFPGMPVYPGTEAPSISVSSTIARNGFEEKKVTIYSHTGTHLDAPAHVITGGKTLDLFPVQHFCGPAVVVDMPPSPGQTDFSPADLEPYRSRIENSEFVILRTGWSRWWGQDEYFKGYPVLSREGAEWLACFNLKGIGLDAISVDSPASGDYPIHKILLARGVLVIENLTNLASLPGQGFLLFCFPLKIGDADGSPARVLAAVYPGPPGGASCT